MKVVIKMIEKIIIKYFKITISFFLSLLLLGSIKMVVVAQETSSLYEKIAVTIYNEDANSRGFNWITKRNISSSELQYLKKDLTVDINNINWDEATIIKATYQDYYADNRAWQAAALNLEYNETYFYRIGSSETNRFSKVGELFINDGLEELNFIHITDIQGSNKAHYELWIKELEVINSNFSNIDSLFVSGDLTDTMGYQPAANNEWGWFLNGPQDFLMNYVMTAAAGNHDTADGIFYHHLNVQLPNEQNTKWGFYYNYQIGNVEVIVLNTNDELNDNKRLNATQVEWFKNVLKNSTALFKIVMIHEGLISTGKHMNDRSSRYLREDLMPLISEYHVDLVLQGHDHVYSRSNPYLWDTDGTIVNDDLTTTKLIQDNHLINYDYNPGTYYVTQNIASGNEGKRREPLGKDLEPNFFSIATSEVNGKYLSYQPYYPTFGHIEIKGNNLTYQSYYLKEDNSIVLFDEFNITKTSPEPHQTIKILNEMMLEALLNEIDGDLIIEIDNLFNSLSSQEKSKLQFYHSYQKLKDEYLAKERVSYLIEKIANLENNKTIKEVTNIRILYSLLDEELKFYVENYFLLVKAEIDLGIYRKQVHDEKNN